jgi:hypothetical protein
MIVLKTIVIHLADKKRIHKERNDNLEKLIG